MSGTVKLIGSADQHWDETLDNADHSIETRLIGREDIYWDSEGKGEQGSFVDRNGTDRPITMLNASHIPLPISAREACEGAENVAEGMIKLSQMSGTGGGSGSMSEDETVTISSSLTHAQKQTLINSKAKNLGGHVLTFEFPEAIDLFFNDSLIFSGFYNGSLVIDLNGITISDNINLTKLFYICDCTCKVEVKDGTMQHTVSQYGILAERCPYVYLNNMIFIGSGRTNNFAFCGIDSDGYASGCSYSNDNQVTLVGFGSDDAAAKATAEASSAVNTHNVSGSAHSALFAGKAALNHTHTPEQAGADPSGTASATVGTHNSANNAHSGILAPLNSPALTGTPTAPTPAQGDNSTKIATTSFVATALDATPGIIDRDVSRHNASATAHSGILAPLASPVFTGTPEVPTAVVGTETNQAASTKFVKDAIENSAKIPEIVDTKLAAHNTAGNAHKTLFDSKANANHTHTPQAVSADPAGTAASSVSTHNSSNTAHSALFAGKSNIGHTHPASEANADPAGTASSQVSTHNSNLDAHASLMEKLIPPGTVFPFAGNGAVPSLFLLCDGRAVSRTTYRRLFNVIGILYGSGDGTTTFNIPDFRGAFLRGYQSGISASIGQKQAEGLPNIKSNGYIATENKNSLGSGSALYHGGTISRSRCGDQDYDGPAVYFDASRSSSIYGASSHVTPVNYAVQYIIRY